MTEYVRTDGRTNIWTDRRDGGNSDVDFKFEDINCSIFQDPQSTSRLSVHRVFVRHKKLILSNQQRLQKKVVAYASAMKEITP